MSLLIVFTRLKENYHYRILVLSCGSILIISAGFCVDPGDDFGCQVQAGLLNWGRLSVLTFSGVIFYCLNVHIEYELELSFKYFALLSYALPGLVSGVQYSSQAYSRVGNYCFISPSNSGIFLAIISNYFPLIFSFFFTGSLLLKTSHYLNTFKSGYFPEEFQSKQRDFHMFKVYAWCLNIFSLAFGITTGYYWTSGTSLLIDILALISFPLLGYGYFMCFLFKIFSNPAKKSKVQQENSTVFLESSVNPSDMTL